MSSLREQAYLKTRVGVYAGRLISSSDIARYKGMSLSQLGESLDLSPIIQARAGEQPAFSRASRKILVSGLVNPNSAEVKTRSKY